MQIVLIAEGCDKLKEAILKDTPSPMTYNAPKPKDVLEEDKIVERLPLRIQAANVRVVRAETLFE
jgi:zinc protease